MGKILSIVIGSLVTIFGLILLIGAWRWEFFIVLKGTIPVIMIVGGIMALIAGISEYKDTLKSKKG